jgi:hypothetical protein
MDRGVRGEMELGLLPSGHLYCRRFCPVSFSVPDTLFVGEGFSLLFQVLGTASSGGKEDWVGLFPVGSPNVSASVRGRWYKTSGTNGVIEWAAKQSPPTPGQYEFRYFRGAGYTCLFAVSNAVTAIEIDGDGDGGGAAPTPSADPRLQSHVNYVTSSSVVTVDEFTHVAVRCNGSFMALVVNGVVESYCKVTVPVPMAVIPSLIGAVKERCVCTRTNLRHVC